MELRAESRMVLMLCRLGWTIPFCSRVKDVILYTTSEFTFLIPSMEDDHDFHNMSGIFTESRRQWLAQQPRIPHPQIQIFHQKLDHFNYKDTRQWLGQAVDSVPYQSTSIATCLSEVCTEVLRAQCQLLQFAVKGDMRVSSKMCLRNFTSEGSHQWNCTQHVWILLLHSPESHFSGHARAKNMTIPITLCLRMLMHTYMHISCLVARARLVHWLAAKGGFWTSWSQKPSNSELQQPRLSPWRSTSLLHWQWRSFPCHIGGENKPSKSCKSSIIICF